MRRAMMGVVLALATLVGGAGGVQDPFGQGGLAGIDVGQDAEIADTHFDGPSIAPRADGARPTARDDSGQERPAPAAQPGLGTADTRINSKSDEGTTTAVR